MNLNRHKILFCRRNRFNISSYGCPSRKQWNNPVCGWNRQTDAITLAYIKSRKMKSGNERLNNPPRVWQRESQGISCWTICSIYGPIVDAKYRRIKRLNETRVTWRAIALQLFIQVAPSGSFPFCSGEMRRARSASGAPPPSIDRSPAPLNMAPGVAFALSLVFVIGHLQDGPGSLAKSFTFPEYPYKETTKNVSRPCPSIEFHPRDEWYACTLIPRLWREQPLWATPGMVTSLMVTPCTPVSSANPVCCSL